MCILNGKKLQILEITGRCKLLDFLDNNRFFDKRFLKKDESGSNTWNPYPYKGAGF